MLNNYKLWAHSSAWSEQLALRLYTLIALQQKKPVGRGFESESRKSHWAHLNFVSLLGAYLGL